MYVIFFSIIFAICDDFILKHSKTTLELKNLEICMYVYQKNICPYNFSKYFSHPSRYIYNFILFIYILHLDMKFK